MKFLSVLLLALPLATQAAVDCCEEELCASCSLSTGIGKQECMDEGGRSFWIWHPTEGKDVCMPMQPGVVCCWDTKCTACGEGAPGSGQGEPPVDASVCFDGGFPSHYDPYKPGEPEDHCMPSGAAKLVDCCREYKPGYDCVADENRGFASEECTWRCPGGYCDCQDCNIRMTLAECQLNPDFTHYAEYYHNFKCKSISSAFDGDPHVKTWAGKWFDYHGECDLVMMHVDSFEEQGAFSVHARTKIRNDYSYISNAVLRIGADTLEVASWGDYSINGVGGGIPESRESETILGTIGGYKIHHSHPDEKQHSFTIYLGEDESLEFATFKDLVSIRFTGGSSEHFGQTHGLMGDFGGRKLGRDGRTVFEDINAFGQEWQVQPEEGMLFVTEPAAGQCKLPNITAEEKRRLAKSVDQADAEKACAGHKGDAFHACVLDVQLVGDVGIAAAGGY